jgi:GDPmannose 4,6-dehydratase
MTSQDKVALIFGITGQTGSYLAEQLHEQGNYIVHGVVRRTSNFGTERIKRIFPEIRNRLHYGDVLDSMSVIRLIEQIRPQEIYNLAAQSHVQVSFELPLYTTQVDAIGTLNILEAVRSLKIDQQVRIFQANTSEMFGGHSIDHPPDAWLHIVERGMNENTPFFPKSPYGVAKLYAHHLVKIYRESYNMFVCSAIAFNHESERRDPRFVTRKVTRTVARIARGLESELLLGNMSAVRDWGYAQDYALAFHKMLQQDRPIDLVIATGQTYTVKDLVETAFRTVGITLSWKGNDLEEKGFDDVTGRCLVKVDPRYYRPNEVHFLKGDSSKARDILNWSPSLTFDEMIERMVRHDLQLIDRVIKYDDETR